MATDPILRALMAEKPSPWIMARASYAHSRAHGLTIREALNGAFWIFMEYRRMR